ncbi:hsp70-binding protein 1, partial [Zonotrichia leucophrys gambelii]|uniref:hsp70-binding protein 1 n=1 Tax=Zonotrichia leucophrys gambelii TaxID=257770 RepID=UPI0031409D7B
MAAAAGGGAGGGRREPPHTLQGLLEMAVVAGEAQPEPRQPMAEERQQWLRAALSQAISGPGSVRAELQRCLRLLAGPCPGEAAPERGLGDTGGHEGALEELCDLCESLDSANGGHEGALEELCDLCESLDNANEFCSLGGLEVVLDLLGHRWPPLRAGAARLLGSCAQNLPEAQGRALALGALPALMGALRGDPDPSVAPAALFAVSCLVRAQPEGLQELEALGGLEVLGGALQSPQPQLRARAAFLLHCLLREHPRLKGRPKTPQIHPKKCPGTPLVPAWQGHPQKPQNSHKNPPKI